MFNNTRRRAVGYALLCMGLCLSSGISLANSSGPDTPIETTQPVDTQETGQQGSIDVVSDAVGNVLAIYSEGFIQGGDIFGRQFPASAAAAPESVLLETLSSDCNYNDIAASGRADGQFILVWCGDNSTGAQSLYGQRYTGELSPIGDRLTIDVDAPGGVRADMNGSGEFVVLWYVTRNSEAVRVAQHFDSQGSPVGAESLIEKTAFSQSDIAIAESGAFAVAYTKEVSLSGEVYLQRFTAGGELLGDSVQVSTGDRPIVDPRIEIAGDGTILVVWSDESSDIIRGRIYNSQGSPMGDVFTVVNADVNYIPDVAASVSGGFVVTWQAPDETMARRYATDGTASDPVVVYEGDDPDALRIAMDADGDYASLWSEDGVTTGEAEVFLRRYAGPENVDIATRLTVGADALEPGDPVAYELIIDNNHDAVAAVDTQFTGAAVLNRSIGAATGLRFGIEYTAGLSDVEIGGIVTPDDERGVACENTEPRVVVCVLDGPLYPGESISARVTGRVSAQDAAGEVSAYATANQFDANELTENDNNTDSIALSGGDAGNGGSGSGGGDDDDGSGGGGCTMAASDTPFDPLFVLVLVVAASVIARRRSARGRRDV